MPGPWKRQTWRMIKDAMKRHPFRRRILEMRLRGLNAKRDWMKPMTWTEKSRISTILNWPETSTKLVASRFEKL